MKDPKYFDHPRTIIYNMEWYSDQVIKVYEKYSDELKFENPSYGISVDPSVWEFWSAITVKAFLDGYVKSPFDGSFIGTAKTNKFADDVSRYLVMVRREETFNIYLLHKL